MTLVNILVFCLLAAGFALVGKHLPPAWRSAALLVASVAALYGLQPPLPIRNLDFWLPTASLALTVFVWAAARPQAGVLPARASLPAAALIAGTVCGVALLRYAGPLCCLTPTLPPAVLPVLLALGMAAVAVFLMSRSKTPLHWLPALLIIVILALFIILKSERLSLAASALLRMVTGQDPGLASPLDLRWLGFSYLAFRWLHVLRDYQGGKLPAFTLGELVTYAAFFPALVAGPIDRSQRFVGDLRSIQAEACSEKWFEVDKSRQDRLAAGSQRVLVGLLKKFVLADGLALVALNSQNAAQVTPGLWTWVLLYAFALRIYFDFAGYTDVAVGLGMAMGIKLPENFDRPYYKTNLTVFWNSWHMSLAQWFRAYVFNPLTRALRASPRQWPAWLVILTGQLVTMVLIGLWHGLTWNFAIWGAWHGLGLFVHNRWADFIRPRLAAVDETPHLKRVLQVGGWFLTFNFVTLGWIWFAMPTLPEALLVFQKLF